MLRIKQFISSGLLATATASTLVLSMVTPASADTGSVTDRVDRAFAASGVASTSSAKISVGDSKISISSESPSASISTGKKAASIALAAPGKSSSAYRDTGRAFSRVAPDTDAVVRSENGSAQILSVMQSDAAPTQQRYEVGLPAGEKLVPSGSGFKIVDLSGKATGSVEAPWAKDATGKSLPTRYLLEGNTLVQETDTAGAVFPVVADPKLTYGLGVYLNMWGYELRAYVIEIIALGGVGFVVACTATGYIPNPALKILAQLICGAASINLTKVWKAMVDTYNTTSIKNGSCYQMKIVPSVASKLVTVGSSNCS